MVMGVVDVVSVVERDGEGGVGLCGCWDWGIFILSLRHCRLDLAYDALAHEHRSPNNGPPAISATCPIIVPGNSTHPPSNTTSSTFIPNGILHIKNSAFSAYTPLRTLQTLCSYQILVCIEPTTRLIDYWQKWGLSIRSMDRLYRLYYSVV